VTVPAKPRPDVHDPATEPFWRALREHRVCMQRCDHCGYVRWPAAPRCPECLGLESSWCDLEPRGTVWSHVVYHRAFHPAFENDVPYCLAYVELDDGPRLVGRLHVPAGRAPSVGARVEAAFDEIDSDVTLLAWRLAD
jgi:uncharacterized OB-fold protein